MSVETKPGRVVTYKEGLSPIMSHDPLIIWSFESCDKLKSLCLHYKSAYGHQTKQDLTYRDSLLPKKLYDTLIT